MKQVFEGHAQARDFAEIESRKQNRKMIVFLTRTSGIQYLVCDSQEAKSIVGKPINEFGKDVVFTPKPVVPPPTPKEVVEEKVIEEEKIEETTATNEEVVETVIEPTKDVVEEESPTEKPKKTRKKKEDK